MKRTRRSLWALVLILLYCASHVSGKATTMMLSVGAHRFQMLSRRLLPLIFHWYRVFPILVLLRSYFPKAPYTLLSQFAAVMAACARLRSVETIEKDGERKNGRGMGKNDLTTRVNWCQRALVFQDFVGSFAMLFMSLRSCHLLAFRTKSMLYVFVLHSQYLSRSSS